MRIPNWLPRGKLVCHARILALKFAHQRVSGRFLACCPFQYQRHLSENTFLYWLVKERWPLFQSMLAEQGVFSIEIEKCEKSGGKVKINSCIEDPEVIEEVLEPGDA